MISMEKTLLVLSFLYVGWISLIDSHNKDDNERLQRFNEAIAHQKRKYDIRKVIERVLTSNNDFGITERKIYQKNEVSEKGQGPQSNLERRHHDVKQLEHRSDKDKDLIRAIESLLKAKRARQSKGRSWLENDLSQKGSSTTSTTTPMPPQTPPKTTKAPIISWCRWSWWCRR